MRKRILKFSAVVIAASMLFMAGCGSENATMEDMTNAEVTETETEVTTEVTEAISEETEKKDRDADKTRDTAGNDDVSKDETGATTEQPSFAERANADTGTGTPKELYVGDLAPDFTVNLRGGGTFHLSDYDDKIVLINFWATWCGPCVGELPAFDMLLADGYDNLEIICINRGDDQEQVDNFIDELGYTFKVGYDMDRKISTYYPSTGIPYTVVINKGVVSAVFLGSRGADMQYKAYKEAIEACME
ncbi:MAG: TlpA family protein disulfide reductase [Eubacterium sp.]|nr:TlpA family protein disulfide reductase [Eubacterium sp.]